MRAISKFEYAYSRGCLALSRLRPVCGYAALIFSSQTRGIGDDPVSEIFLYDSRLGDFATRRKPGFKAEWKSHPGFRSIERCTFIFSLTTHLLAICRKEGLGHQLDVDLGLFTCTIPRFIWYDIM